MTASMHAYICISAGLRLHCFRQGTINHMIQINRRPSGHIVVMQTDTSRQEITSLVNVTRHNTDSIQGSKSVFSAVLVTNAKMSCVARLCSGNILETILWFNVNLQILYSSHLKLIRMNKTIRKCYIRRTTS